MRVRERDEGGGVGGRERHLSITAIAQCDRYAGDEVRPSPRDEA